ncbi:MAG: alpha/beta fold hydrolase [Thermoguttaceae bacterium]|nr:alpha/beta fold hydrolase [Thermoguttaceae bacterium]
MGIKGNENGKKSGGSAVWRALANAANDARKKSVERFKNGATSGNRENSATSEDCETSEDDENSGNNGNGGNREISVALNDEKKRCATRIWEEKKNEAENVLTNPAEARSVVANFQQWLERFATTKNWATRTSAATFDGVKTLFRALQATFGGEYRGFSKKTLVALTAAALYCVAPIDALLDWIPVLGLCDDLFVVAVALKTFAAETRAFRRWERIKTARELFSGGARRLAAIERVVLCPGWQSEEAPLDEIVEILRPIFPRATFERYCWPSNVPWKTARDYVDGDGVEQLAQFTATLPTKPAKIALIGHSLGARATVRALARRARSGEAAFGAAFLLGAAVDADESELGTAARGVLEPLGNFFAASDRVLKYAYQTAEGKRPLGLRGAERKWDNYVDCEVAGNDEFWLEFGENAATAAAWLGNKALWTKFPLSADVAAKAMEASRHCFAQYATFLRSVFEEDCGGADALDVALAPRK